MSGPTPGPWAQLDHFPTVVVPEADRHKKLGWAADPEVNAREYTHAVVHDGTYLRVPEKAANARLISAAPELYEALAYVAGWNTLEWDANRARDLARTALAKARGEAAP